MLHFNIGLNSLNILAFCGWRGHCNTACSDGGARKIWQNFYEFGLIKFLMIYMMSRYILCIYNWKLKKRNEWHLLCIILLYNCFFQITYNVARWSDNRGNWPHDQHQHHLAIHLHHSVCTHTNISSNHQTLARSPKQSIRIPCMCILRDEIFLFKFQ